jgi:hypothetical protein
MAQGNQTRRRVVSKYRASSLIEAVIAIAALSVASVGALSYQYHGARQVRIAECQLAVTRVGQLLIEDWKATGADPSYNPSNLNLGFVSSQTTSFGSGSGIYTGKITVGGVAMEVRLSLLDAPVEWVPKSGTGTLKEIMAEVRYTTDGSAPSANDQILTFTTYVRKG